jgi:hypothetical protein
MTTPRTTLLPSISLAKEELYSAVFATISQATRVNGSITTIPTTDQRISIRQARSRSPS